MSTVEQAPKAVRTEPMLITAGELAHLLHVSLRTVWRLNAAGALPEPVRLGGTVRWRIEELKEWIADGCPCVRKE